MSNSPIEQVLANFGIRAARQLAWNAAEQLAPLAPDEQEPRVAELDAAVTLLARAITHPGPLLSTAYWIIRRRELTDPRRIIDILARG